MPKKFTFEVFHEKAINKHNGKYQYDAESYVNMTSKVNIICLLHGEFLQTPAAHLSGQRM